MSLIWLGFMPVLLCASLEMKTIAAEKHPTLPKDQQYDDISKPVGQASLENELERDRDQLLFQMDSVIAVLEDMESHLDGTPDLPVMELFQELDCKREFCHLPPAPVTSASLNVPYLTVKQKSFLKHLMNHETGGSRTEYGVVLTPDGTTVSLSPLLGGIVGGLRKRHEGATLATPRLADPLNSTSPEPCPALDSLLAPLAKSLAVALVLFQAGQSPVLLGPNGCWNSISMPLKFTFLSPPSSMPDAFINGAMDGVILGMYLARNTNVPSNISTVLHEYYSGEGPARQNQIRSNFRRQNFAALVSKEKLREQLESSLCLFQHLHGSHALFKGTSNKELASLASQAVEEFMALYVEDLATYTCSKFKLVALLEEKVQQLQKVLQHNWKNDNVLDTVEQRVPAEEHFAKYIKQGGCSTGQLAVCYT